MQTQMHTKSTNQHVTKHTHMHTAVAQMHGASTRALHVRTRVCAACEHTRSHTPPARAHHLWRGDCVTTSGRTWLGRCEVGAR
eukprot:1755377-Rhodomonas_salina.1